MADIDPAHVADQTEFQTSDYVGNAPARDAGSHLATPTVLSRRYVSSQELPRFSRTSIQ